MGLQKAQSVSRSAERKWHIVYDKRAIHPDFERLAVLREAPGQQADARQAVADAVAGQQIMRRLRPLRLIDPFGRPAGLPERPLRNRFSAGGGLRPSADIPLFSFFISPRLFLLC